MALYRIMIVDDEEEIRDGIRRKIDWSGNGFELVAAAENGQEALEFAETLHPDVVMTDIKMPFMDGLTLGQRLAELLPGIKIVIFSGFDDFEYAQKAIQLNVSEYLLKPIDAAELTGVLQKLKTQLDNEFAEKRDVEQLRTHFQNTLPLLREQFLNRLIGGGISQEKIEEQMARYELDLSGEFWTVALAHYERKSAEGAPISDPELIPLSIQRLIDENLSRHYRFKSFLHNEQVAIIIILDDKNQTGELITYLSQICLLARRFLELNLTIGVGSPCGALTELRYSAAGARTALDYRVFVGAGRAIYIDDMEPEAFAGQQYDELDERELISAIKLGTPETIESAVGKLIERFKAIRLPLAQSQLYFMEMVSELLRVIRTYQIAPTEVFGKDFDGNFHLTDFDSLDKLSAWFNDICLKISGLIRRERINSTKAIADNARQFIAEHFMDFDISVEMLCAFLHISPAYFSTLFKKETGMSFVAYLTEVRMQEAIRLLSTTENKTYEISLKVGYAEPNYFSYVFKKRFGMSPTKYRSSKEDADA